MASLRHTESAESLSATWQARRNLAAAARSPPPPSLEDSPARGPSAAAAAEREWARLDVAAAATCRAASSTALRLTVRPPAAFPSAAPSLACFLSVSDSPRLIHCSRRDRLPRCTDRHSRISKQRREPDGGEDMSILNIDTELNKKKPFLQFTFHDVQDDLNKKT